MAGSSTAVAGVLAAIAITTTMDATGLAAFSALPLLPLLLLFWRLEKLPRRAVGFAWGGARHYALAVLHPLVVIGGLAAAAWLAGAIDPSAVDWARAWRRAALIAITTAIVVAVTEEGFFRGWLWASVERAGRSRRAALLWTSVAFALWHVSPVTLDTGFDPPPEQVPVYLLNVVAMGLVWGLLRWMSGSVLVASVSHGLWNGGAYAFFGFGREVGELGVEQTGLYGPELGILGLAANVVFAALLWWWWMRRGDGIDLRQSATRPSLEPAGAGAP
jgi:membrane protease YdiL (CAAX protease family)